MSNLNKLIDIKDALNNKFIERENEVEAMLVALLSKQHMLMIGPAGTGKSALSAELSNIIDGTEYFQWLLTKFSTPEEIFGTLSLKELENGVYKRNTAGKMPESHIAFLDEIFKANSAILNSLLTLVNERIFYNNGQPSESPLMSVIGSSNEYPDEDEGLEALFDRFLLRFEVEYIGDEDNFISMLKGDGEDQEMPKMTIDELQNLQFLCEMVTIPDEVFSKLSLIRTDLKFEGIRPSDRRFKQSLSILQAKALIEQRQEVKVQDILLLEHTLWENIDQKTIVSDVVNSYALDKASRIIINIEKEKTEILNQLKNNPTTDNTLEANKKLKTLVSELKNMPEYKSSGEIKDEIDKAIKSIQDSQKEITETILEPIDL